MTTDRRSFLRQMALLSAGLSAPGLTAFAQSAANRRSDGYRVIDIHAHCVVPDVAPLLEGTAFSEVPFIGWQTLSGKRIADMDARGIDIQVLSINRYWWYRADEALADEIVHLHDKALADWCTKHPARFAALSSVAVQFPELAAEQLERGVREYGLRGASVGGSVLGEPLSSPRFDPFWAKAEALNVPVFMHPTSAAFLMQDAAFDGSGDLGNIVGNPLETTLFLSRLIFDGTLDRFPNLKIVAPHAGGYLPSYLGRTEVACDVRPNANCQNKRRPTEYLKDQIMIDSMIFSDEGLRHLVAEVGASQVVYGSDMPFNWPDTIELIANAEFLSAADKQAILGGNLEKLLGIQ